MSMRLQDVSETAPLRSCTHEYKVNCETCRLSRICLPLAINHKDLEQLENIIQRSKPLQKNELLYHEGSPFQSIYAVRSGAVKGYRTTSDGREQVTGFYFPGEILGMDGISNNSHASSARALETSAICAIPFDSLERLSASMPSLQRHLFQLMSREITEDQLLITLLSKNSADERVATPVAQHRQPQRAAQPECQPVPPAHVAGGYRQLPGPDRGDDQPGFQPDAENRGPAR